MAARIDARVRQLIINFTDQPRRGEVTRFCREHGISRAEFYKVRARAKTEGKLAAVTAEAAGREVGRRDGPATSWRRSRCRFGPS